MVSSLSLSCFLFSCFFVFCFLSSTTEAGHLFGRLSLVGHLSPDRKCEDQPKPKQKSDDVDDKYQFTIDTKTRFEIRSEIIISVGDNFTNAILSIFFDLEFDMKELCCVKLRINFLFFGI